jgi:hypothetical protein
MCGTLYFACWYITAGLPVKASASGAVYFQMIRESTYGGDTLSMTTLIFLPVYEFLYTAIGQAIATYSPNEYFASLANHIVIECGLLDFCGVVVPYDQIQAFWRYWMYYLDPVS